MDLPKIFSNENKPGEDDPYLTALKEAYNEYFEEIKDKSELVKVEKICKKIIKSYTLWCDGKCFEGLKHLKSILDDLIKNHDLIIDFKDVVKQNFGRPFFKARVSEPNNMSLDKKNMLHIPLNKRHLVKNQRFSISGCPCIYLGNSSYDCWVEMGKPEFSRFYVSSIMPSCMCNIKLLNLYDDGFTFSNGNRVFIFPLIIAISFKNYDNTRSFKPEYVISSMIMSLILHLGCVGVVYASNCIKHDSFGGCNKNIAILAGDKNVDRNFSVGNPLNFRDYQLLAPIDIGRTTIDTLGYYVNICEKQVKYENTEFSLFDAYIIEKGKKEFCLNI